MMTEMERMREADELRLSAKEKLWRYETLAEVWRQEKGFDGRPKLKMVTQDELKRNWPGMLMELPSRVGWMRRRTGKPWDYLEPYGDYLELYKGDLPDSVLLRALLQRKEGGMQAKLWFGQWWNATRNHDTDAHMRRRRYLGNLQFLQVKSGRSWGDLDILKITPAAEATHVLVMNEWDVRRQRWTADWDPYNLERYVGVERVWVQNQDQFGERMTNLGGGVLGSRVESMER